MEAEAAGAAPEGVARRVLEQQERLIGWQIASERAGFALKVLTGAAGIAVAVVLAVMVWQASQADGLVIRPFSVPPELAQKGATGEALASQLLDQLNLIGETARGSESPTRVAADWGHNVSIEISQTGISVDQLQQWLRAQLGHQTLVSGEVMATADGQLTLVARVGDRAVPTQTGAAADLPALIGRTAEAIYRREQPFSYIQFLDRKGRIPETMQVAKEVMLIGDRESRAKAWVWWGNGLRRMQGIGPATEAYRRAYQIDRAATSYVTTNLATMEGTMGHNEVALRLRKEALAINATANGQSAAARRTADLLLRQQLAEAMGDSRADLAAAQGYAETRAEGTSSRLGERRSIYARALSRSHQTAAAWAEREEVGMLMRDGGLPGDNHSLDEREPASFPYDIAIAAGDWNTAASACDRWRDQDALLPDKGVLNHSSHGNCGRAYALAGKLLEAEAVLATTPVDCLACLIGRATLAEAKGEHAAADRWFGEASRIGPSLPRADHAWGRALLARGDADGALKRAEEALRRSPRYSDAMELAGEALLAQGRAKEAAARFAAAAKGTPRWGRLHLKWGEALAKADAPDKARAVWRAAASMDLTTAERDELHAVQRRGG